MKKPIVLAYENCSTCKKALKFLEARGIEPDVRAIVEEPPTKKELRSWIACSGKAIAKWLNTSGKSYREAGGKETFEGKSEEQVVEMLAADGKLVKRPVLVMGDQVLVGFNEEEWKNVFA